MFFKVIFNLDGTGVYYDPNEPPHLDSLLAWVLAPRQGANPNLQRDEVPDHVEIPLKKQTIGEQWVWRASALFPEGWEGESLLYIRRRFRQNRVELTKGSPNLTNGIYRDWNLPMPVMLIEKLVAYGNGNRKECKKILKEIKYIGKKRSYGYGKINSIEFEEMTKDYSLSKDGYAMRILPDPNGVRECRINPPYWNSVNRVKCCNIGDKTIHS